MIPPLIMMALAPVSGRISDRIGSRTLCIAGSAISCLAFAMFLLFSRTIPVPYIAVSLFVLGASAGVFMAPNNKLVLSHVSSDKQGSASGVYKISLNLGSIFGIALLPFVIINLALAQPAAKHLTVSALRHSPEILQAGFNGAFVFGIIISALAILASLFAVDRKDDTASF